MELTESIRIAVPATQAFDAWAQLDRAGAYADWVVERRRLTAGPVGKGSRIHAVDRWPGRRVSYTVEITAYERPERIAGTWSNPLSGGWDAIFEPIPDGTELRFHATLDPPGPSGLALRLLLPWYRRQVRTALAAFRDQLETGRDRAHGG